MYYRLESQSTKNIEDIKMFCHMVCIYFLPFIKQTFEMFFPATQLSEMIARLPSCQSSQCYNFDIAYLQSYLKDFVDISATTEAILPGPNNEKE